LCVKHNLINTDNFIIAKEKQQIKNNTDNFIIAKEKQQIKNKNMINL